MKIIQIDEILSLYNGYNVNPKNRPIRTNINTGNLYRTLNTGSINNFAISNDSNKKNTGISPIFRNK